MQDGECLFECPKCHNNTSSASYPVIQNIFLNPEGEYIGCDCCGVHMENADDYAVRMYEEIDEQAREERHCE